MMAVAPIGAPDLAGEAAVADRTMPRTDFHHDEQGDDAVNAESPGFQRFDPGQPSREMDAAIGAQSDHASKQPLFQLTDDVCNALYEQEQRIIGLTNDIGRAADQFYGPVPTTAPDDQPKNPGEDDFRSRIANRINGLKVAIDRANEEFNRLIGRKND